MDIKSPENAATIIQAYWRGYRIRNCILRTRFEYEEIAQEIINEAGFRNETPVRNEEVRWPCEKKICYPVHDISNKYIVSKNEEEMIVKHYQPDSKIRCDENDGDDGIECLTVNADDVSNGESNNINVSTNNKEGTSRNEQPNKLSSLKKIEDNVIRSSSPIFSRVVEEREEEKTSVIKDKQSNLGKIQTGGLLTESWMTDKSFDDTSSTSSFVNSNDTTNHDNTTRNTNNFNNNNNNNVNNSTNSNYTTTNNYTTTTTTNNNNNKNINNNINNNNSNDNSINLSNNVTKEGLVCKEKELMLELIWLQQAIHSRKVYLQLKRKAS